MELAIKLLFKKLKTYSLHSHSYFSCLCLWYRHWFVSNFCSSQFQVIQSSVRLTEYVFFIEAVLVIYILSQKSNPETLLIFASIIIITYTGKQHLQLLRNLSERNLMSDVNLLFKTPLFDTNEPCSHLFCSFFRKGCHLFLSCFLHDRLF